MLDGGGRAVAHPQPVVVVDGQLWPDVRLVSIEETGPSGERRAVLTTEHGVTGWNPGGCEQVGPLESRRLVVLQPVALSGGDHGMYVLFSGRVDRVGGRFDERADRLELYAKCDWSQHLVVPITGLPDEPTVGDAIETLRTAIEHVSVARLTADDLMQPLGLVTRSVKTAGELVRVLIDRHDLLVQHQHTWDGRRVHTTSSVIAAKHGRVAKFGAIGDGELVGSIRANGAIRAVKLIGLASAPIVESTFELKPGWDPVSEGQADGAYGKSTNPDFDEVASVYRLWVLNEDGVFGEPAYDLAALFNGDQPISPQALRFDNALTHDAMGKSVGVVVDHSIDEGGVWQRYPGMVVNRRDHAAVYIDDDELPLDYLNAARAGTARVRVTATLTSPLPTEVVRWAGNPFAGLYEARRLDLRDRFVWRRIDAASKYAADVKDGVRTSDARDDRADLDAWLARCARTASMGGTSGRVDLAGSVVGLRVGDRLGATVGEPVVAVSRIERDWARDRTRVHFEPIGGAR